MHTSTLAVDPIPLCAHGTQVTGYCQQCPGTVLEQPHDPGRCVICGGVLDGRQRGPDADRPLGRHEAKRDHCPAHGALQTENEARKAADAARGGR